MKINAKKKEGGKNQPSKPIFSYPLFINFQQYNSSSSVNGVFLLLRTKSSKKKLRINYNFFHKTYSNFIIDTLSVFQISIN